VLGGWAALLAERISPTLAAFLVLLLWVIATGALHIDGFCDLCDALFGGPTPEERLQIMKDPHVGAFGLAGVVLLLLGKFVLLVEVLGAGYSGGLWWICGVSFVYCSLVLVIDAGALNTWTVG